MLQTIKNNFVIVHILLIMVCLLSCIDPLTKAITDQKFSPLIPIEDGIKIGNIYRDAGLTKLRVQMSDKYKLHDNGVIVESNTKIPDVVHEEEFNINAGASFIGELGAMSEIKANDIKKYSITFKGVKKFILNESAYEEHILPKIKTKLNFEDHKFYYVVSALLQVESLEYKFYNSNNVKVDIEGKLISSLKGTLGAGWNRSKGKNLSINKPTFIGFQLSKLISRKKGPKLKSKKKKKYILFRVSQNKINKAIKNRLNKH